MTWYLTLMLLLFGSLEPRIAPSDLSDNYTYGVGTYYTYKDYGENPLYCDGRLDGFPWELRYTKELMAMVDWVAVDYRALESGEVQCGDLLRACVDVDPSDLYAVDVGCKDVYVLDAGLLGDYYVEDFGPDVPIVVDFEESAWFYPVGLPWPAGRLSALVHVVNLSELEGLDYTW